MKKKIAYIFVIILFILAIAGCQSVGVSIVYDGKEDIFTKGLINNFAKQNLPTFKVIKLKNGIPVIIKINPYNRIYSLKVFLEGGVALTNEKKAGIEKITLAMLTRGSKKYNYDQIKKILSDTSSSISYSPLFDSSSYDLNTLDKYFDQTFDVFADTFVNPTFEEKYFNKIIQDAIRDIQNSNKDPYTKLVKELNKRFFKGHPYAASWDGTINSLVLMKLQEVKEYYEKTFSANRMFIVAVGNFNTEKLIEKLDKTFGNIPNKNVSIPQIPDFVGKVKNDAFKIEYEQAGSVAYVRGDFAIPQWDDPEFVPLRIALVMLDDLLFEIVRTENSACYSAWANVRMFKGNYGSIVIYKTQVPGEVKEYIDRAISLLANGKCLSPKVSVSAAGKGGLGKKVDVKNLKGKFGPISKAIEFYKAQFINSFYESQQTNAQLAAQIAYSILYANDYRDYLLLIDKVNKVTPEEIIKVFRKYLYKQPILWGILGSSQLLQDVNIEDYKKFLGD